MNEEMLLAISRKMLATIVSKRTSVQLKYRYYDAEQEVRDLGISMPVKLLMLQSGLGWASKAVDVIADRMNFDAFENDRLGINALHEIADETEAVDQAKVDARIAGCAFIGIVDDPQTGEQRYMPFTALEATGVLNTTNGLLKYGLAITRYNNEATRADKYGDDSLNYAENWVLFTEEFTAFFEKRRLVSYVPNRTGRTRLYLFANEPSTKQPFGRSAISRDARLLIQSGLRTLRRSEVAGEFYSAPQRYLLGISEEFEKEEGMDLQLGKIALVEGDGEGNNPTAGQWTQQSMTPFSDQLKMFAQQFCVKTKLTLHQLGFDTANPTSAESYEAQHEDQRVLAVKCQKHFGRSLKRLAIGVRLAASDTSVITPEMRAIKPHFDSFFRVEIGKAGDAVNKVVQVLPQLKESTGLYYHLGMSVAEAEKYAQEAAQSSANISTVMTGTGGA